MHSTSVLTLAIADHIHVPTLAVRASDGAIAYVNQALCDLYGRSHDSLVGMPIWKLNARGEDAFREVSTTLATQPFASFTFQLRLPSGETRWIEPSIKAADIDGERYFVATITDISRRVDAEEARQSSDLRYDALFRILPIGVAVTDEQGQLIDANPASEEILGLTRSEHQARRFDAPEWATIRPDGSIMPAEEYASVRALREQRTIAGQEAGVVRPDGQVRWIVVTASPIPLEGFGVVITYVDVTRLKQAEQRLQRAQELASLAYCTWHPRTDALEASSDLARILGIPGQPVPGTLTELLKRFMLADDWDRIATLSEELAHSGTLPPVEYRVARPDGSIRHLLNITGEIETGQDGRPFAVHGIVQDITERKEQEARLLDAQKLEAIGLLTGGIAHEFNSIISALFLDLDLLRIADLPLSAHEHANEAKACAERAAVLVKRMLAFGHRSLLRPKRIDLCAEIRRGIPHSVQMLGDMIDVALALEVDAADVVADPLTVREVLGTFCGNARDAMPHGGRVRITVGVKSGQRPAPTGTLTPPTAPVKCAYVEVSDNGPGLTDQAKIHLFEPFFSTKDVAPGRGLGLASSKGLIEQQGGWIEYASTPGQGATFRFCLPLASA